MKMSLSHWFMSVLQSETGCSERGKIEHILFFYETKSSNSKQESCPRWAHSSIDMSLNKLYKESSDDDDDDDTSLSSSSRLSKNELPSFHKSQEERDDSSHTE